MKRTIKIQTIVFFCLLLVVELGFRLAGQQPGLYNAKYFKPVKEIIHQPLHWADSSGATRYLKDSPHLPDGHVINKDGFRSPFDYNKNIIDSLAEARNAKVVMLIGDSYTDGCCAQPITESFADKLGGEKGILLLNFGMSATDPTQYWLIAKEYLPKIQPDLVIVIVYLGNDVMYQDRLARPFTTPRFPVKGCGWLPSENPFSMDGNDSKYFKTPQESYDAMFRNLTLLGGNRSTAQIVCRQSAILSKLYFGIHNPLKRITQTGHDSKSIEQYDSTTLRLIQKGQPPFTNDRLRRIQKIAHNTGSPLLTVAIPAPMDAENKVDLQIKYNFVFNDLDWHSPDTESFSLKDYDGKLTRNHFNNQGHHKYYEFLLPLVRERLKKHH